MFSLKATSADWTAERNSHINLDDGTCAGLLLPTEKVRNVISLASGVAAATPLALPLIKVSTRAVQQPHQSDWRHLRGAAAAHRKGALTSPRVCIGRCPWDCQRRPAGRKCVMLHMRAAQLEQVGNCVSCILLRRRQELSVSPEETGVLNTCEQRP